MLLAISSRRLEIHVPIVVAALEKLFHFFQVGLTRVGASAGISNGVLSNFRESFQEDVLGDKAIFAGIAVSTVVLDALGNVQVIVHFTQVSNQIGNLLFGGGAAQTHEICDNTITYGSGLVLGTA